MSRILKPISTLPPGATHETVQLYKDAQSSYGMPIVVGGLEECIPCREFAMTVQDAKYWGPRERPLPTSPKFT